MPTIPPLPPFPTYDELELYFHDATTYIPGIPSDVAAALRGLYHDLMRFGPPEFPELPELPEVGKLFVVQTRAIPPPQPPPPKVHDAHFVASANMLIYAPACRPRRSAHSIG